LALAKPTAVPPAGAAELIVTVPVELVPPVTVTGLKLTPVTVGPEALPVDSRSTPVGAELYVGTLKVIEAGKVPLLMPVKVPLP